MASAEANDVAKSLTGRRALVTGSSRNLGAEIARELARRGAAVAVTYKASHASADALVSSLGTQTGLTHVAVEADLSKPACVGPMVDAATDRLGGPIDVLVNNYGPFSIEPFHKLEQEEFEKIWSGNVAVSYRASQAVADGMRSRGWGRIVNLSAGSAYLSNHSIYGLAKAALIKLTESLALELGPYVTVNAVAPGQIEESAGDVAGIDPTFVGRALERTPAGRLVRRKEVAELVAAICTPPFDMLTGTVIPLDGGWRLNRF